MRAGLSGGVASPAKHAQPVDESPQCQLRQEVESRGDEEVAKYGICRLKPRADDEDNGDNDYAAGDEVDDDKRPRAAEVEEADLDALARLTETNLEIDPQWAAGPRDLCVVFWSSGTTGAPKGIPKTNQQLLAGTVQQLFTLKWFTRFLRSRIQMTVFVDCLVDKGCAVIKMAFIC